VQIERKCLTCGGTFRVQPSHADRPHYCSRECKLAPRPCLNCGGMFSPRRSSQRCCSKHCTLRLHHRRTYVFREYQCRSCGASCHGKPRQVGPRRYCEQCRLRACLACGRVFSTPNVYREGARGARKFCSAACFNQTRRKDQVKCKGCSRLVCYRTGRKFCTHRCARAWQTSFKRRCIWCGCFFLGEASATVCKREVCFRKNSRARAFRVKFGVSVEHSILLSKLKEKMGKGMCLFARPGVV
jgi:hypothetical protein